jgi:hypothetical protein
MRVGDAESADTAAPSRSCAADRLVARWLDPGGELGLVAIATLRWRGIEHRVHDCSGFERVDEPWWWTRSGERHRWRTESIVTSFVSWQPMVRLHLRARLASGLLLWVRCDPVRIATRDPPGHRHGSDACERAVWLAQGVWA